MNTAHFHLMVNHLPLVGVLIGLFVLAFGVFFKKEDIIRTATGIFIFSSLMSAAAFLSGEEAEEVVEDMQGVSETMIHIHEESAELFLIMTTILGIGAILVLILSFTQARYKTICNYCLLILSVITLVISFNTGNSGGQIRHSEIRSENQVIHLNDDN